MMAAMHRDSEPPHDCQLCPRLAQFRAANRAKFPDYFNNPVPTFSAPHEVRLLIVGLAPGLHGANRTGRPFTGDWAGDLLYASLLKHGLARGEYRERADDGLQLVDCAIANAVRCVPPENKPLPVEINTCRQFLVAQIEALPHMRAILALGKIAHDSTVKAPRRRSSARIRSSTPCATASANYRWCRAIHCSRYSTPTPAALSRRRCCRRGDEEEAKIAAMPQLTAAEFSDSTSAGRNDNASDSSRPMPAVAAIKPPCQR